MAHPYQDHKDHKVQHRRVGALTGGYAFGGSGTKKANAARGYASGGAVSAEPLAQRDAVAVTGEPVRQRLDRPHRAKGGRTKSAKSVTNVIVAGAHPGAPVPPVLPGAPPTPALPLPPRPGVMPPPPAAGAGPAPGAAPMGPRKAGGRAYASGGRVDYGPGAKSWMKNTTPVQHTNNKLDGGNIGRGKVFSYATGGAVEHPESKQTSAHKRAAAESSGHRGGYKKSGPIDPPGTQHGPVHSTGPLHATNNRGSSKAKRFGSMDPPGENKSLAHAGRGPTEHPVQGGMGPKFTAGSKSGLGRLQKAGIRV